MNSNFIQSINWGNIQSINITFNYPIFNELVNKNDSLKCLYIDIHSSNSNNMMTMFPFPIEELREFNHIRVDTKTTSNFNNNTKNNANISFSACDVTHLMEQVYIRCLRINHKA